jgi:hypothetical protein
VKTNEFTAFIYTTRFLDVYARRIGGFGSVEE